MRFLLPLAALVVLAFIVLRPEPVVLEPVDDEALVGRPTALLVLPGDVLVRGDQGGGVTVLGPGARIENWVAHSGSIRHIEALDDGLMTVGGGSAAAWSMTGERRWRRRLADHHLNGAARLGDAVIVGAAQGSVARLEDGPGWHRRGVHARATFAVAVAPDGGLIASGGADGGVAFWTPEGQGAGGFVVLDGWVTGLAWTGAGLWVADTNGRIGLYDRQGRPTFTTDIVDRAFVSLEADGALAVAGDEQGGFWRVRAVDGRADVLALDEPDGVPLSAIALRGEQAWAARPGGSVAAWNVTTGLRAATLPAISDGRQR